MPKSEEQEVVGIDEHALDRECIRIPTDYLRYCTLAADARNDVDETKAAMELTVAECVSDVREDPESYDLEKVTESAINNKVAAMKVVRQAKSRHQKARHRLELLQAVVSSLDMKKRSLSLLVELHGRSYYADVKVSKEGKDAVEETARRRTRRSVPRDED